MKFIAFLNLALLIFFRNVASGYFIRIILVFIKSRQDHKI